MFATLERMDRRRYEDEMKIYQKAQGEDVKKSKGKRMS